MDVRSWFAKHRSRWAATLTLLVGVALGIVLMAPAAPAESGDRGKTGPPHFKSGSERSLVILRDIKSTLDRIDSRLERLEKFAEKAGKQ